MPVVDEAGAAAGGVDAVVDALADGLAAKNAALDEEQAVRGLDHHKEIELHAILAASLEDRGFFVAREQRYPSSREKKQRSSGKRCDLVVTRGAPLVLEDPQPGLWIDNGAPFAGAADLQDALWIEVKVLKQHTTSGPNHGWQASLLAPPTEDIAKLSSDPGIKDAALLLLLFTNGKDVAEHDAGVWRDHVLQKGLVLRPPIFRHLTIAARLGNTTLTLAWLPVSSPFRLG